MSQAYPFSEPQPAGAMTSEPTTLPVKYRHPLGLPRGSVRALLTFMILGTLWTLLLIPPEKLAGGIPPYLFYLTFLVLGSYFGARSHAPHGALAEKHPLHLPRGSIRLFIIVGFAAVVGYGYYTNHDYFERLRIDQQQMTEQPFLPFVIFGAFFLGIVGNAMLHAAMGGPGGTMPALYQDILAWVSLLAVLGLAFEVIYQVVIVPTTEHALNLPRWQTMLSGIVAFYFGARS